MELINGGRYMPTFKTKLSLELKNGLSNNYYKYYRVLIHCKTMQEKVESKINSYHGKLIYSIPSIKCVSASLTPDGIERLLEFPQIDYITIDKSAQLCGSSVLSSNDIVFTNKYTLTGKGIGIGIVDSGVYPHADLILKENKVKKFIDLINNIKFPYDDNGHGTFIAGLICGSGSSSKGMYKGIASGSHLYFIKAFNSIGKGYISDVLYSLNLLIEESSENNIKVICLPFELNENDSFILSLFQYFFTLAWNKNIIIVVPTGHNGNEECSIRGIATLSDCLTVGGLDTTTHPKAYKYSSAGPFGKLEKPDLCAACVDICSLNTDTGYISERNGMKVYPTPLKDPYTCFTGTSCAAAYIAGICSLIYQNKPDINCVDVVSLLKMSCNLLSVPKWLQGSGQLDFNKLFF